MIITHLKDVVCDRPLNEIESWHHFDGLRLINIKYSKKMISYKGLNMVETPPFPEKSLREAVLNAVMHNDCDSGIPIQIRIWGDRMRIADNGGHPVQLDRGGPDEGSRARACESEPGQRLLPDRFRGGLGARDPAHHGRIQLSS